MAGPDKTHFRLQVDVPIDFNTRLIQEQKARGYKRKADLVAVFIKDGLDRIARGDFAPAGDVSALDFGEMKNAIEDLKHRVNQLEKDQIEPIESFEEAEYQMDELLKTSFPRLHRWAEENFNVTGDNPKIILKALVDKGVKIRMEDGSLLHFEPKILCENIWCREEGHEAADCPNPDPNAAKTLFCDNCGARKKGKVCPNCTKKGPRKRRSQCPRCHGYHPEGKCKAS